MKIGLYFGSFNPVHIGHLIIANHLLNYSDIERVWFIVSPQNPFKPAASLLNEYDRLHLLQLATNDDPRIKISDIEFSLPKPSYTSTTLTHLTERYPDYQFQIIMGSDSFQNLARWHNADYIISNFRLLVYKRPGFDVNDINNINYTLLDAPLLELSATQIRQLIRDGKSIKYMTPDVVIEEISKSNYYRK